MLSLLNTTLDIRDVSLERSPFTCYCKHRKRIKQRVIVYLHTLLHITDKLTLKNKHSAYTQTLFITVMTSVDIVIYEFKNLDNKIHDHIMMNKQNKTNLPSPKNVVGGVATSPCP